MNLNLTERITSRKNPTVLKAAKLHDRKYREASGTFSIEGIKLFEEAVAARADIKAVFATESAIEKYSDVIGKCNSCPIYSVTDEVFEKLSTESAPQGIYAVCGFYSPESKPESENPCALILDEVCDPGNIGTIIRCADAFGIDCVYIGERSADIYNPKTVRACMGSLFRVRTEKCDATAKIAKLREEGYRVYAAMLDERAVDVRSIDTRGKVGFVIGNEGHGISPEVAGACSGSIIIPMSGGTQSLNAAIAASLLMWEAAKVRL